MNFNSWFLLPSCFASNSILRFRSSGLSLKYWLTRWPKIAPKNHREDINTISTTRFFFKSEFFHFKNLPSVFPFFLRLFFFLQISSSLSKSSHATLQSIFLFCQREKRGRERELRAGRKEIPKERQHTMG